MNAMKEKKGVLTVVLTGSRTRKRYVFTLHNALLFALYAMKIPKTLRDETAFHCVSLFVVLFYWSRAKGFAYKVGFEKYLMMNYSL